MNDREEYLLTALQTANRRIEELEAKLIEYETGGLVKMASAKCYLGGRCDTDCAHAGGHGHPDCRSA